MEDRLKLMKELMDGVSNRREFEYFKKALVMICEARRAIAWTYPYGYFLKNQTKK